VAAVAGDRRFYVAAAIRKVITKRNFHWKRLSYKKTGSHTSTKKFRLFVSIDNKDQRHISEKSTRWPLAVPFNAIGSSIVGFRF
jgi:hypothetical protein